MDFEICLIIACLALGATQVSGQACGGNIGPGFGSVLSPGYSSQDNYTDNLDCVWIINAPVGSIIELRFADFELEVQGSCLFDYVTITGAASNLHTRAKATSRYCGDVIDHTIYSTGNTMSVTFHSDGSVVRRGFSLEASPRSPSEAKLACGGLLTGSSGSFTSPNYPAPYPANIHCFWDINPAPRLTIQLTLRDVQLEEPTITSVSHRFNNETFCDQSFIQIENPVESTIIGTGLCGRVSYLSTETITNSLGLSFRSGGSVTGHGFRATYSTFDTSAPQ